jgi:hypothetical protein
MGISRIDSTHFDWLAWRNGSILEVFNVNSRTPSIIASKELLRRHAIGWCPSESVPCRPKVGCVSVMFYTDDRMWWTHITKEEFDVVFPDREG